MTPHARACAGQRALAARALGHPGFCRTTSRRPAPAAPRTVFGHLLATRRLLPLPLRTA